MGQFVYMYKFPVIIIRKRIIIHVFHVSNCILTSGTAISIRNIISWWYDYSNVSNFVYMTTASVLLHVYNSTGTDSL